MPIMRLTIIAVVALLLWPAAHALASDPKADRAEFDTTYAQFKDILEQSLRLQDSYATASPEQRLDIQEKFNTLRAQGNALRPKLKALAEKVYLENPKDQEIADLIFSMAIDSMRNDEYDEVVRLAKILLDRNYGRNELYNFGGIAAFFIGDYDDAATWFNIAKSSQSLDERAAKLMDEIPEYRQKWAREEQFRAAEAKANDLPRVRLTIGDHNGHVKGTVVLELFEDAAPNTVANFISLVNKGFYNGTPFHRVLPGFMAQGGDGEKGDGTGGPGYHIADEAQLPNHREHFRGSLSMAKTAEKNSGGSQFFITFAPTGHLDGIHTVFGRVIEGMDVVEHIQRIDPEHPGPMQPDKILKAEVIRQRSHAYTPVKLP